MAIIRTFVLLGLLMLIGCTGQPTYTMQQIANQLPVGTRLEIATPFTYPAGQTDLWFQAGEIKSSRSLSIWLWHCSLDIHLSGVFKQPRELREGGFIITGIREERLAEQAISPLRKVSMFQMDNDYMFGVMIALSAPDYPEVRQLRCERRIEDWTKERALTLEDVRATLGRYLVVKPGS